MRNYVDGGWFLNLTIVFLVCAWIIGPEQIVQIMPMLEGWIIGTIAIMITSFVVVSFSVSGLWNEEMIKRLLKELPLESKEVFKGNASEARRLGVQFRHSIIAYLLFFVDFNILFMAFCIVFILMHTAGNVFFGRMKQLVNMDN